MQRRVVRVAAAALVAAAIVLVFQYVIAPRETRVSVGELAPDIDLPSAFHGGHETLRQVRGSPVLLSFLDTRWPVAHAYLQGLEAMHRRYLRRGLVVMAVALDDDPGQLRSVLPSLGVTFAVLADPGGRGVAASWGAPRGRLPETYLIAPEGRVLQIWLEPPDWELPSNRNPLEDVLRTRRAPP